jgi:hypothetical protein
MAMSGTPGPPENGSAPRREAACVELRWQIWLPWLVLTAVLLTPTRTDPDLWGHVRFGLDWLAAPGWPQVDPYSFTQDRPWVNHEWLSEALMAAAYRMAGGPGLILLKAAALGAAVAIVAAGLAGASPLAASLIMAAGTIGTLPLSGTIRPQVWSVVGLAIVLHLLQGGPPARKRIFASALLFACWANLHGGWITGGAALGVFAIVRSLRAPATAPAWLAMSAASLVATLANPYGPGLWRFLATTVRASRPDISEWAPFSLHEPPIMWVSILTPLLLLAWLTARRDTRPPLEAIVVVFVLIAAGLKVSRVAPLISIPAIVPLAPFLAVATANLWRIRVADAGAAVVFLAPAVLAAVAAASPLSRSLRCLPINDDWAPDRVAAAQLAGLSGRLWTNFNWGEYAIWHFGPALRVSVDGRRETVYSDDVLQRQYAAERGEPAAIQAMIALHPDIAWLPADLTRTRNALTAAGYRVDVTTPQSFVAVRSDHPPLTVSRTALPACFP